MFMVYIIGSYYLAAQPTDCIVPSQELFFDLDISDEIWSLALRAYCVANKNELNPSNTYTIIDYSLHSSQKRLWVLDLKKHTVVFHDFVAHGKGSDNGRGTDINHDGLMSSVSNENGSNQTSVGLFRTAETYIGKHGLSLKIDGLEIGFNDQARSRAIVIHGASYVSQNFLQTHGKMGRSQGCPAVDDKIVVELISTIKNDTLVFGYLSDDEWLKGSHFLN